MRSLAAAIMFLAVMVGWKGEVSVQMKRIHISAAAWWEQGGTPHASLRVALQVPQRQDRATASNRNGVVVGPRKTHDSQGSEIEAVS